MIGISFCTIAFQENKWGKDRRVERPLGEILPILAEAGYDAAEVWGPHVEGLDPSGLDAVRSQLTQCGPAVSLVSPYFDFTTSEASARRSLELGGRTIDIAAALGARGLRCFTGKTGSDEATAAQWDRAVQGLRTLADAADERSLILALETHSRNLMDTIDSSAELVERIDRRNVGLIYQASTFGAEDYLDALDRLAPHVVHVHATNARQGARALLESGDLDYARIVDRLKKERFRGFLSVEWLGPDPETVAVGEARYLRRLIG